MGYEEHHFQNVKDVGVAWDDKTDRVWVCVDGATLLRVSLVGATLHVEYNPPIEVIDYTAKLIDNAEKG